MIYLGRRGMAKKTEPTNRDPCRSVCSRVPIFVLVSVYSLGLYAGEIAARPERDLCRAHMIRGKAGCANGRKIFVFTRTNTGRKRPGQASQLFTYTATLGVCQKPFGFFAFRSGWRENSRRLSTGLQLLGRGSGPR